MKKIGFAAALMAAGLFSAGGSASQKAQDKAETVAVRTAETQKLLDNLKAVPSKGIMFGHHDDTVYGIGWEGDEGRSDVQSVCDSLKYDSQEKRMTMYGNPIVWSNNQQLLGEVIYVYMNDSTIDSAHVERQALLAEKLDSMFYNQVAGREMFAYFKDGQMDWSKVVGNVDVAYYPYDSDSIMIGLNRMQTSEMRMYMKNRKMNKIWSAPAEGTLYPLNLAPQEQFFLSNFAWFDYIRPKDKHDIFVWREKAAGTELRETIRRTAPLQTLSNILKRKTQGKNDVKNESRE